MHTYWLVILLSILDEELKIKFKKNTKGENVNVIEFQGQESSEGRKPSLGELSIITQAYGYGEYLTLAEKLLNYSFPDDNNCFDI